MRAAIGTATMLIWFGGMATRAGKPAPRLAGVAASGTTSMPTLAACSGVIAMSSAAAADAAQEAASSIERPVLCAARHAVVEPVRDRIFI
jgi:hypothetical protein